MTKSTAVFSFRREGRREGTTREEKKTEKKIVRCRTT